MSEEPKTALPTKKPNLFIKNPQQNSYDGHISVQKTSPINRLNNSVNQSVNKRNSTGPLEDLVQCPICLDRLSSSRMLPCQHTFCLSCLQLTYNKEPNKSSQSISCPTCQLIHSISDEIDLHALPSNLYIDSLLDLLSSPNGSIMTPNVVGVEKQFFEIRCFKCKTSCAGNIQKCLHCKLKFCNICWESHMTELLEQMGLLREKLATAKQRINHRFEDFEDRCEQTKAHAIMSIEEKITDLLQKKVDADADCSRLVVEAGHSRDELLAKIQRIQLSIEDSSAGPLGDQASAFVTFHNEISIMFNEIAQWKEDKIVFNKNNYIIEVQVAMTDVLMEASPDNVKNEKENIAARELKKQNVSCFNNSENLLNHYKGREFKPKLFWTRCSRPTGIRVAPWTFEGYNLLYIAGSESKLVYGIERNSGKIFHRISHNEMLFPHFIEFSKDREEIFISDKWKHCIFVFSKAGDYLRTLGTKGESEGCFRSPEGLAIGKTNNIYVCDTGNNRVQCLDIIDGRMLMQFGLLGKEQIYNSLKRKKIAKRVDLNAPTSLAVLEDKIIVMDTGNRRVKTFNKRGDMLAEFGHFGSGKGQFRFPEAIALDQLGNIYVGDSGNTRVQIFQPNGVFVASFGVKGSTAGKFEWISGITVTEDLDIIVSDYKNHSVQVF